MYWKPYVRESKRGYQILIDMPNHVRPHVVKDDCRQRHLQRCGKTVQVDEKPNGAISANSEPNPGICVRR